MPPFRRLAEQELLVTRRFRVTAGTFESPDGERFQRDILHHSGAVAVVPLVAPGTALLVRQYRAAIDRELLEIPAGIRDVAGEPVETTAARELAEELGRRAGRLQLLARFYNSAGFSDELTWVFLGTDLDEVELDLQGVEEQHMTTEEVALDDVPGLIAAGELMDAKTVVGLTLARQARR